jgi:hypothetical protein
MKSASELSLKLFDLPAFQVFQERLSRQMVESFENLQMLKAITQFAGVGAFPQLVQRPRQFEGCLEVGWLRRQRLA